MRRNLGTNLQGFFSSQEDMGFLGSHLPGILVRQYQYNILHLLASIYPGCLCMDDLINVCITNASKDVCMAGFIIDRLFVALVDSVC
jgi:hypothetical protein